jgi:ferric-dicitrate binding protein FerR (iron transport regulator)
MWPVMPEDRDARDAWRKAYRETTEALERIRAQELAAMTDETAVREIRSLRSFGPARRERPDGSGLVEQQAILNGLGGA